MAQPVLGHFIQQMREELLSAKDQSVRILQNYVQIKRRDQSVIAAERRVITARNRLNQHLAAQNNQIHFEVVS